MKAARTGREPTLTGTETITELDSTAPVTLAVKYPSAAYTVTFGTVTALQGTPAAGAFTPSAVNQSKAGFTVSLAEVPGIGAGVSVPWTVTP